MAPQLILFHIEVKIAKTISMRNEVVLMRTAQVIDKISIVDSFHEDSCEIDKPTFLSRKR